jgi:hypothetical protein
MVVGRPQQVFNELPDFIGLQPVRMLQQDQLDGLKDLTLPWLELSGFNFLVAGAFGLLGQFKELWELGLKLWVHDREEQIN